MTDQAVRLFFAVNFDSETKDRLLAVQNRIKKQSFRGNFSRQENLHLTVVFIGEADAGQVPALMAVLKDAVSPGTSAFSITFDRTGCFRHSGKELWWIGTGDDGSDPGMHALAELRRRITCALNAAAIPFDDRPFRAHITLGREVKPAVPSIVLPQEKITVPVTRISLMISEHIEGVLTYTEIAGQNL